MRYTNEVQARAACTSFEPLPIQYEQQYLQFLGLRWLPTGSGERPLRGTWPWAPAPLSRNPFCSHQAKYIFNS